MAIGIAPTRRIPALCLLLTLIASLFFGSSFAAPIASKNHVIEARANTPPANQLASEADMAFATSPETAKMFMEVFRPGVPKGTADLTAVEQVSFARTASRIVKAVQNHEIQPDLATLGFEAEAFDVMESWQGENSGNKFDKLQAPPEGRPADTPFATGHHTAKSLLDTIRTEEAPNTAIKPEHRIQEKPSSKFKMWVQSIQTMFTKEGAKAFFINGNKQSRADLAKSSWATQAAYYSDFRNKFRKMAPRIFGQPRPDNTEAQKQTHEILSNGINGIVSEYKAKNKNNPIVQLLAYEPKKGKTGKFSLPSYNDVKSVFAKNGKISTPPTETSPSFVSPGAFEVADGQRIWSPENEKYYEKTADGKGWTEAKIQKHAGVIVGPKGEVLADLVRTGDGRFYNYADHQYYETETTTRGKVSYKVSANKDTPTQASQKAYAATIPATGSDVTKQTTRKPVAPKTGGITRKPVPKANGDPQPNNGPATVNDTPAPPSNAAPGDPGAAPKTPKTPKVGTTPKNPKVKAGGAPPPMPRIPV